MKSFRMAWLAWVALLFFLPSFSAQINIDSFTTIPETVSPGGEITLVVELRNVGDDDIENITVSLDLAQLPFAPVGSSTEKTIDELRDRRRESISFTLQALPDAEMQVYKIPLLLSYNGVTAPSLIRVEVRAPTHLDVLLEDSEIVKIGDKGKVTFQFVNDGLTQVQFLKVTLQQIPGYEVISAPSAYVGDVELGDFETEEFTIIPMIADPVLSLQLEYRDPAGQLITESKLVKLPVYTEEEARQLGLVQGASPLLRWGAGILLLVAILILYTRRRRRKHVR